MPTPVSIQDSTNQRTWSGDRAQGWLAGNQGFTDPGERAAFWSIADAHRGQPILDLGVGTGRTTLFLRSLSEHYQAIDYLPSMVEATRQRYPFVQVEAGDARDLSRFASGQFSLVVFSFMGLDAVDCAGRALVLAEVHRVLRPQGVFWFSTFNKAGRFPQMRPWRGLWPGEGDPLRRLHGLACNLRLLPRALRNQQRLRAHRQDGDGWLLAPLSAHDYGLLVHYSTLQYQREQLRGAGFDPASPVFDQCGHLLSGGEDLAAVDHFNVVARRLSSG